MALRLDDKKALVAEVAAVAATAQSVVAAEYRGLKVSQMTDRASIWSSTTSTVSVPESEAGEVSTTGVAVTSSPVTGRYTLNVEP